MATDTLPSTLKAHDIQALINRAVPAGVNNDEYHLALIKELARLHTNGPFNITAGFTVTLLTDYITLANLER